MLGSLLLSAETAWTATNNNLTFVHACQAQVKDIGPMRAAEIAKQRHGGKVLKVQRQGSMYRVKLLLKSGKVKSVYIDASG